jgi:hypothetical protein
MTDRFEELEAESNYNEAVISFPNYAMLKIDEFAKKANDVLASKGISELYSRFSHKGGIPTGEPGWISSGVKCEILRPGEQSWHKGKIKLKIVLEFCPDEPELSEIHASQTLNNSDENSPLDDIRAAINN